MYKYDISIDNWDQPLSYVVNKVFQYNTDHVIIDNVFTANVIIDLCHECRAGQWATNLGTVGNRHGFEFSILLIETARAGRIVFTRLTVYLIVNRISTNRVTISL